MDDSERSESEIATLHQVSVDVPRTSCASVVLKSKGMQEVRIWRARRVWKGRSVGVGVMVNHDAALSECRMENGGMVAVAWCHHFGNR